MIRRVAVGVLLTVSVALAGAGLWRAAADTPEASRQQQAQQIASTLRCPTCQGQSVASSPSEVAQSMRGIIAARLAAGQSPDEIRAWFAGRYGPWVLLSPPRRGLSWLVWLLPVAGLLAGAVFATWFARRRRPAPAEAKRVPERESPAEQPDANQVLGEHNSAGRAAQQRTGRDHRLAIAGGVFIAVAGTLLAASVTSRGPGQEATGAAQESPQNLSSRADGAPTDEKLAQLRAATRERPADEDAWVALGRARDARGDLTAAYRAYRKASEAAPEARGPQLLLASALLRGGSEDESATITKELVDDNPEDARALLLLGLAQRADGDPAAGDTLRRYLRLEPDGPAADTVRTLLAETP